MVFFFSIYKMASRVNRSRRYGSLNRMAKGKMALASSMLFGLKTLTNSFRKRRKTEGPGSAITNQNDSMTIYRRKRAPKKVRKRAAKRYKRFVVNQLKGHKDNTNLFTTNVGSTSAAGQQLITSVTFGYIKTNAVTDECGNWYEAFQNYLNADPTLASKSFHITGMTYDVSLTNGTTTADANAHAMELDVYEFVFRKNHDTNGAAGVKSLIENELNNEVKMAGSTLAMGVTSLGMTPFDANQAMKYIVIKSKQRYNIGRGQSVSFIKNIKFSRPIKLISSDFSDPVNASGDWQAFAGVTRGLIFIQKGTASQDGLAQVGVSLLLGNVQSRYRFKIIDTNANQNALNF